MKKATLIYKDLPSFSRENSPIVIQGQTLECTLFKTDSLTDVEKELFAAAKISFNQKIIYGGFTVLAVFGLLFLLGAISVFENLFYKIFIEKSFELSYANIASVVLTLTVAAVLLFLPSFAQGESSALSQGLKSWFLKDIRRQKRLKKAFLKLDISKFEIYNIDIFSTQSEFFTIFLVAALQNCTELKLHIRKRNEQSLKQFLSGICEVKFSQIYGQLFAPNGANSLKLFDDQEQKLFEILTQSSFYANRKNIVAFELYNILASNLAKDSKIDSGSFLNECFEEFYLLKDRFIGTATLINSDQNSAQEAIFSGDLKQRVEFYIRANVEHIARSISEPVSLLCLYQKNRAYGVRFSRQIFLLKELINSAFESKNYNILAFDFFDIIGDFELASDRYSIYKSLEIGALEQLLELLKKSAHFAKALDLSQYLMVLNPFKYGIISSVLFERMGKFDEAFEMMRSLSPKNSAPEDEIYYHERFAWLIVSARFMDKQQIGLAHLDELWSLIDRQNPKSPSVLWNYHNIRANYHEWSGELDKAIKSHENALCIPGIGSFEYGASLLNYSTVLRLKFIQSKSANEIKKAVELAQKAVFYKVKIGDKDELPLIYHNLALHYFYGIKFGVFNQIEAKLMLENGQNGYNIATQNSSSKRLATMLAEIIIAKDILNLDSSSEASELQNIQISDDERQNIDELFAMHFGDKFRFFSV